MVKVDTMGRGKGGGGAVVGSKLVGNNFVTINLMIMGLIMRTKGGLERRVKLERWVGGGEYDRNVSFYFERL